MITFLISETVIFFSRSVSLSTPRPFTTRRVFKAIALISPLYQHEVSYKLSKATHHQKKFKNIGRTKSLTSISPEIVANNPQGFETPANHSKHREKMKQVQEIIKQNSRNTSRSHPKQTQSNIYCRPHFT